MNTKNWKLKDVLLIAICAVLFGVVYLGCTYVGGILYGVLTPMGMASLGYEPFYGIYLWPVLSAFTLCASPAPV